MSQQLVQKSQHYNKDCLAQLKPSPSDKKEDEAADTSELNEELARTGSSCQDYTPGSSTEYDKNYDTLNSIGKGAFGFVKLAVRKSDKEQVMKLLI